MLAEAIPLASSGAAASAPSGPAWEVGEVGGVLGGAKPEALVGAGEEMEVVQSRPRMTNSSVSCRPMVETSAM